MKFHSWVKEITFFSYEINHCPLYILVRKTVILGNIFQLILYSLYYNTYVNIFIDKGCNIFYACM